MEKPKLNVIRGTHAPSVTKPKGMHPALGTSSESMFIISPASPTADAMVKEALKGTSPHPAYKEVSYLDGDGIGDYTLISDGEDMFAGRSGTRVPVSSPTGGFTDTELDPLGVLYSYGTEDEKWLEESPDDI